jgi:hypothetical protein
MSDPYQNPVYSGMVPSLMTNPSVADKGESFARNNMMGFTGGMVAAFPPIVTYDNQWYYLRFETINVPVNGDFNNLRQEYNYVVKLYRNQGGMDCHPGGTGDIWPFIHQSDRQLKLYVLHYPGDSENRRIRLLRTGIYY